MALNIYKNGLILVDKPSGWSSFDVVAKVRGSIRSYYKSMGEVPTKRRLKVGHAGTLDPFATGLLILLIGERTKDADEFIKMRKTYRFTAKLGEVSTTGDPEGSITPFIDLDRDYDGGESNRRLHTKSLNILEPSESDLRSVIKSLTGKIMQTPPVYSAIKINGRRAYSLAREGKDIKMPSRQVSIYSIDIVSYQYPYIEAICEVSSGTYIRSLVEDMGKLLGTGAYCTQLRRLGIDVYKVADAIDITDLPQY